MIWQDGVFLLGSVLSILLLVPTVRDATASVPLATSVPAVALKFAFAGTFYTLGMTLSAVGATGAALAWALVGYYRSPRSTPGDRHDPRHDGSLQ